MLNLLKAAIPARVERLRALRASKAASTSLAHVTVATALGGMRGAPVVYWEASKVDPEKGVTFHGKTIEQCQQELPTKKGHELAPETMFMYLLTGHVPSSAQANEFASELAARAKVPDHVLHALKALPDGLHPMAQLSVATSVLGKDSQFAAAYQRGIPKSEYWQYVYEDALDLLARMPAMIGYIYRRTTKSAPDSVNSFLSESNDWSANLSACMGISSSDEFTNLVRLYCSLHADHEGGNVSSHATHLVGSALSDPFLSYSAGIQGLAGPLHGLAAQEVVKFVTSMHDELQTADAGEIEQYLWSILNSHRVIPGYGHAVLRKPDPRFTAMLKFGLERPDVAQDPMFQLVQKLSQVAPKVLTEHGKTKNPFPNVDSISGVLFRHYGLHEMLFYTVVFAGSRAFGPMAQLIWDRILGMPIERPKSMDMKSLERAAGI